MPTYVIPQVLVFQDFQQSPAAVANALRAHISGPHAQLVRYAESDERPLGRLAYYDPINDAAFDWPNRQAGGRVDDSYTKLFCKDALLKYFTGSAGGAGGVVKVAGKRNRVRAASTNFADNGSYARDESLNDRDVRVGDVVKLRFPDSDVTLWSYVSGLVADAVAAVTGTATRDANNGATATAATTHQQVHGPWNAVDVTAASAASYDPYPTGQVTETYTVVVTGSSVGGDFTTAALRVTSASGLDDVQHQVPSASGVATPLGTLGATVTFGSPGGTTDSESADDQGVSPVDLVVGQRWVITVRAAFTQTAAPTAAGTYAGASDTTYVIEVVQGSKFADDAPRVKVTTTTGSDVSGPTPVGSAGVAVPVGTKGVTVTFAGAGLVKGDRFYVPVTAVGSGPLRTLVLGNVIPAGVADGETADLTLYIRKPDLQVSRDRTDDAPAVNFSTSDTQITVKSGITAFDPSWTLDGVPQPLPVESASDQGYGMLYVEYRAWLQSLCNEVGTINDVGLLNDQIPGALDPDNPLKWGVFKALENSNGVDVKYTSVCSPDDVESWAGVLELLLGRDDVYGLVPLTRNVTVWDLFQAHVSDQSAPEQGLWRVAWFNLAGLPTYPVVAAGSAVAGHTQPTTTDGAVALATITDDPDSTGTQYTVLTCTSGNATFVANGVRAGDVVRALYNDDGFGNATYQEFVVDEVLTEESLRLLHGPAAPVNAAAKFEVWRPLTATEEANEIARVAGSFASRRVRCVWPDTIETAGTVQEGYHLCAALAGLRSGILPHQGMTRLAVSGFTDVARTTKKFNKPQLDTLSGNGVWVVTQALQASAAANVGEVYTRHAVTTAAYSDINQREEVITSNVDSISFRFKDTFEPYIGVANVTPSLLELLRLDILSLIEVLKTEKFTATLGGQLIDATVVDLRQHLTLRDRIVLVLRLQLPYPFNNMEVHLVVPAATTASVTPAQAASAQAAAGVPTTESTTG